MIRFTPSSAVILCVIFAHSVVSSLEGVVHTKNGPLQGVLQKSWRGDEYFEFLGVRYAEPVKRFEPPEPLKQKWTEPKVADKFGSTCPQKGELTAMADVEDCLFANVYVPKSAVLDASRNKLPVMVWIHGGGFAFGAGSDYSADYMMDDGDVIFITINYRLDLLGFLNLEDDSFYANNGLRDQVAALQWIQENIASFGGDSSRVTIFGESAGSASVYFLLMSPLAEGLFSRGIMQSAAKGFYADSPAPREIALKLARHLKCPLPSSSRREETSAIRKCFEKLSVPEVLEAQSQFDPRWLPFDQLSRFKPCEDHTGRNPYFGKGNPHPIFGGKLSYESKVPVMIGLTKDEGSIVFGSFILTVDSVTQEMNDKWNEVLPAALHLEEHLTPESMPEVTEKIREFYFGSKEVSFETRQNLSNMYTDPWFLTPSVVAAHDMVQNGMTVFPYVFDYEGKWGFRKGFNLKDFPGMVGHGDELQFMFQHNLLGPPLERGSEDEEFSKRMVVYWKAFAKNGKPAAEWKPGKPLNWKPMKKSVKTSDIDWLLIEKEPKIAKIPEFGSRVQFWIDLLEKHGVKVGGQQPGKTEL